MYTDTTTAIAVHDTTASVLDRLLFWGLIVFLASYVFEGPLRFALVSSGLPNAIYLRDGVYLFTIALAFWRPLLLRGWIDPGISILLAVLAFHFLIGFYLGQTLFPQLFAIKIFLPVVYGCAMWPLVRARFHFFLRLLTCFFIASIIGVFINKFLKQMPWEGQVYETAFGAVKTTREWWAGGERRLPGLARTSYDAATIIGISGLAALTLTRSLPMRLLVAVLGLTAIDFTTSKGMILAFGLISLWSLSPNAVFSSRSGRAIALSLCLVALLLPLLTVSLELGKTFRPHDLPALFSSLWERFTDMWPRSIALLTRPENYLLGKGLGSIGVPVQFGPDQKLFSSGDNLFVYAYVSFGIFGPLYLLFLAQSVLRKVGAAKSRNAKHDECARTDAFRFWNVGFLIITFGYGLTTNMFEQTFFCTLLGMLFGVIWFRESVHAL